MWTYISTELYHHGILGQKWGKRNGPPYPLKGGSYSRSEKVRIYKARRNKNSIYNKKHFDKVISKDTDLTTLSYNKDRTKGADMFYAAYDESDKHLYNALFNRKIPQDIYDKDGNSIGTGMFYKYRINNTAKSDIKVASEDNGAKEFANLWENDRDFYNFVTDPSRMESHFVTDKYKFRGYREAKKALENIRNGNPNEWDMKRAYRMFNYTIPSDGGGDPKRAKDILTQRTKFFNALSKDGYGACLDTNDAIYGGFKAHAPVIVFDMTSLIPQEAKRVSSSDVRVSRALTALNRTIGK